MHQKPLVTAALIAFQGSIVCHFANLIDCTGNSRSGLTRTTCSSRLPLRCFWVFSCLHFSFFFPLKSLRSPHLVITPSSYIYNTCEPNGSYRSRSWCISVWADDKASEEERADPLTDQYMY
ncbi:hypothetical protein CCMA1212_003904 [Trichoderma ghanense]|uniref:SSCRP protein n=1 Tax=Trichoderma ghanense TaxID=65468 RepID=A0ABY2HA38_9HYPO